MDFRDQIQRDYSGQHARVCGGVLVALAVLGIVVGCAALAGFFVGEGVFAFWAFATAAFLWAMATLLRVMRHVEENTRELARMLRSQRRDRPANPTTDRSALGGRAHDSQ